MSTHSVMDDFCGVDQWISEHDRQTIRRTRGFSFENAAAALALAMVNEDMYRL
jgi:hypothetical protein